MLPTELSHVMLLWEFDAKRGRVLLYWNALQIPRIPLVGNSILNLVQYGYLLDEYKRKYAF